MALWRQFTQWIGGVGIIVMFLAVLPRLRVGGRQALFNSEMPGPEMPLATTIRESARRFVTLYVAITAIEILILATLGWTGVDPRMDSSTPTRTRSRPSRPRGSRPRRARWSRSPRLAVGDRRVHAPRRHELRAAVRGPDRRRPGLIARDEEVRVGLLLLRRAVVVVVGLVSAEVLTGEAAVRHGVFNTVSMLTTTGFASDDFNEWSALPILVLFGVVMLGASAGSTSGSIKLIRHITIAKMLRREIDQTLHPEVVAPLRVNRAVVDERALRAIIVFVFLYLGVCVAGAVAVLLDSTLRDIDVSAFQSLTAAATTLGGAGPSLGFAGPMGSFAPFSDLAKLVLTALMYLGRLEIVPVLVLFTASHWRG